MIEWFSQYFQSNAQSLILGFIFGSLTLWFSLHIFDHVSPKNNFIDDQLDEILTKIDDLSKHMGVKNENPDID